MNKREELRVVEALQALTGGLTVTEPDILMAHNRLKENLEPPSPRRRLAAVAIVAAAAVLAGFVIFQATDDDNENSAPDVVTDSPTPAEELTAALEPEAYGQLLSDLEADPAPTLDDLAGLWLMRPYGDLTWVMFVTSDGDFRYADRGAFLESTLSGHEWVRRTFDNGCPRTQTFTASLAGDASLRLQVAPGDNICTVSDGREVWDPVAPGTPVSEYLLAASEEADWEAAPGLSELKGTYATPETGHLLRINGDGSYRYYDSLTTDEQVAADEGELEFTSGTVSGSCAGGSFSGGFESAVIPGVEGLVAEHPAIRISADSDGCASGVASGDVWVRVL